MLFHIYYQCCFKDNQGLFCERSVYIHTLTLVHFVQHSNSIYLSSSYSISKLHFIQCHKLYKYIYIHKHTHTQPISYYSSNILLHTADKHNMSHINQIFLQTLCQKLPSFPGLMLCLTVSFTWPAVLFTKENDQNSLHQAPCLYCHPFHHTSTSKLQMIATPNKLRSKFLRWSTLKCQIQNNPFHSFISINCHLYPNFIFYSASWHHCNMHTIIFLTLQHENMG
jgi:hypothetical protein